MTNRPTIKIIPIAYLLLVLLQRRLSQAIRERLSRTFDVRPLVDMTVVEG